jgi:hypothetical protein
VAEGAAKTQRAGGEVERIFQPRRDGVGAPSNLLCHRGMLFLLSNTFLAPKKITTKIIFVVDPLGSVPKATTTKFIFITMGAQTGMTILPV